MKTRKQARYQRSQIEQGLTPDIGTPYHNVLSDARYGTLKERVQDKDWTMVFADLIAITNMLKYMGLIGNTFRLTKMGLWYVENFSKRKLDHGRR